MGKELIESKETNRMVIESLRPHFVFNVMNIIRYMMKKDINKAGEMIYDLSLYMRCKIGICEETEVSTTIKDEWRYVQAYLRLEQVALTNLNYVMNVEYVDYEIKRGAFLESIERLVKEQVRVTRKPRTIYIENCDCNGQQTIKVVVKETNVWIQL